MPILLGLAVEAVIVIAIALGIGQIADRADHVAAPTRRVIPE